MIVLITGASHTGKTVLAQKLLETRKIPYLSIDHLKMGLIRSGRTALTPADDEKLTAYLWPVVRELIKTAIENRQDLIVEGCYVPFDWRKDFDEAYLASIRFVCLAMTDAYVDAHFDAIVDFSELRGFLEVPVQNFSSGMTARLAFSIAVQVEPEILIVDEILSVGDAAFQAKSEEKMLRMIRGGTTVLFVSHSVEQIRKLCSRAIWLEHGALREDGEADAVCAHYLSSLFQGG